MTRDGATLLPCVSLVGSPSPYLSPASDAVLWWLTLWMVFTGH